MKLPPLLTLLLLTLAFVFATSPALEAKDPPAYPGQPRMNNALKHLQSAKEKAATNANDALNDLHTAALALAHAIRDKGTYKSIARERTAQAIEYLEHGDAEKAVHKIDEAIDAVTHGGEIGEHKVDPTGANTNR